MTIDYSQAASRNLHKTYFALGRATPGSQCIHEPGFEACLGAFNHPICNFAANLQLDPWVAHRLAELAVSQGVFNVYSLPGDKPNDQSLRDELLVRAGFRRNYGLRQMLFDAKPTGHGVALERAENLHEREIVATFMAGIFFGRHPHDFRRRVAESTLAATELDLYSLSIRGDLTAAVMVARDDEIHGLFNLCVRPAARGQGLGKAIVEEVVKEAYKEGKPVTLQCDEILSPWYEGQGFAVSGAVDVYSLPDERRIAIIK